MYGSVSAVEFVELLLARDVIFSTYSSSKGNVFSSFANFWVKLKTKAGSAVAFILSFVKTIEGNPFGLTVQL